MSDEGDDRHCREGSFYGVFDELFNALDKQEQQASLAAGRAAPSSTHPTSNVHVQVYSFTRFYYYSLDTSRTGGYRVYA